MNNNLLFWPYLMPPFFNKNQKCSNCFEENEGDNVEEQEDCVDSYKEPHYTLEL